jgi:membrane-bound lytic murein transglycosylase A
MRQERASRPVSLKFILWRLSGEAHSIEGLRTLADTAAAPCRSKPKHHAWRRVTAPAILLMLALCGSALAGSPGNLTLSPTGFAELPGWSADNVAAVLPAFLKSCARLASQPATTPLDPSAFEGRFGRVGDWQPLCRAALALPPGDDARARAFFEANFVPALAGNSGDSQGLFTGYYEPEFVASRRREGPFQTPVYRRPADLVPGHPYLPRARIDDGALKDKGLELLWLKSPDELYVLQTQGSGRIRLTDGTVERLVYDANNGLPPVNIEKILFDSAVIPPALFSQINVRAWMQGHPAEAETLRRKNPEYVFFREFRGDGPIGAQGAVLTPERSLAVDHRFVPLGVPLWLAAKDKYRPVALNRLVVAQDTGDGIEGPVRGDFFWGSGADAFRRGGDFYASGQYYLLLPKSVVDRTLALR